MTKEATLALTPNSLITFDEAARRAQKAGFANLDRRWWIRSATRGEIETVEGIVPYLRSGDVDDVIEQLLSNAAQK